MNKLKLIILLLCLYGRANAQVVRPLYNSSYFNTTANQFGIMNGSDSLFIFNPDYNKSFKPFIVPAAATSHTSINIPAGTSPTSPSTGDFWHTSGHLFFRDGSTTTDLLAGGGGGLTTVAFSNTANTNAGSISGVTLTLSAADGTHPGGIQASGSQTLAPVLTMPAPKFSGTTSAGANDSIATIDPATGQMHWRTGTTNFYAANGLSVSTVVADSFYLGGLLNQSTTIATVGNPLLITGLPNKVGPAATDSSLIEDATGKIFKSPLGAAFWTSTFTNTTNVSSSAFFTAQYMRIGNFIHVTLYNVSITATLAATNTVLTFTLPFTTTQTSSGIVGSSILAVSGVNTGGIVTIASGTTATLTFTSISNASHFGSISFDYSL